MDSWRALVTNHEGEVAKLWKDTGLIEFEERGRIYDHPPITGIDFDRQAFLATDLPAELLQGCYYRGIGDFDDYDNELFVSAVPLMIEDQTLAGTILVTSVTYEQNVSDPLLVKINSVKPHNFAPNSRMHLEPIEFEQVKAPDGEHIVLSALRVVHNERWSQFGSKYRYLLVPADQVVVVVVPGAFELIDKLPPCYLIIDYEHLEQPEQASWLEN